MKVPFCFARSKPYSQLHALSDSRFQRPVDLELRPIPETVYARPIDLVDHLFEKFFQDVATKTIANIAQDDNTCRVRNLQAKDLDVDDIKAGLVNAKIFINVIIYNQRLDRKNAISKRYRPILIIKSISKFQGEENFSGFLANFWNFF